MDNENEIADQVVVFRAPDEVTANLVAGLLGSEGISATLKSRQVAAMDGVMTVGEGFWGDVMVPAGCAPKSRELIEAFRPSTKPSTRPPELERAGVPLAVWRLLSAAMALASIALICFVYTSGCRPWFISASLVGILLGPTVVVALRKINPALRDCVALFGVGLIIQAFGLAMAGMAANKPSAIPAVYLALAIAAAVFLRAALKRVRS